MEQTVLRDLGPPRRYTRISTYELFRNEQFIFTNIARTNKLLLPIHLTNTEPRAYQHFNKLTLRNLTIYLTKTNKFNLLYKHI
jgi:sRNA-binding regulator protein Hfq